MDKFELGNNCILCYSSSGKTYEITETSCTCKGFQFRRKCRHLDKALSDGLIDKLINSDKNDIPQLNSDYIKESRKKALILYLKKFQVHLPQEHINKIETLIDRTFNKDKLLKLVYSIT